MRVKKAFSYLLLLTGVIFAAVGIVLIFLYLYELFTMPTGASDYSIVFWHLPLVFLGLAALMFSTALIIFGKKQLK